MWLERITCLRWDLGGGRRRPQICIQVITVGHENSFQEGLVLWTVGWDPSCDQGKVRTVTTRPLSHLHSTQSFLQIRAEQVLGFLFLFLANISWGYILIICPEHQITSLPRHPHMSGLPHSISWPGLDHEASLHQYLREPDVSWLGWVTCSSLELRVEPPSKHLAWEWGRCALRSKKSVGTDLAKLQGVYCINPFHISAWVTPLCSLRWYLGITSSGKPPLICPPPQIRCPTT